MLNNSAGNVLNNGEGCICVCDVQMTIEAAGRLAGVYSLWEVPEGQEGLLCIPGSQPKQRWQPAKKH